MAACPSLDTLLRLDSERIGDETFAGLEAHLEACDRCRGALEGQLRDGSWRGLTLPTGLYAPPPPAGFVIHRPLGRGGMGVVFLATREDDGRPVALKFLGGGPGERARWRREAEAMRAVDHPGVVRLLDLREDDDRTCLVLEFVPGGRLEDRLDRPPSPRSAAALIEAIARAIHEVHGAGLLHLDLKPSNVLLSGGPDTPLDGAGPKVADFGLALPWGDPDATWTMAAGPRGTPSYMAPEQLVPERATLGPSADVYALGAILYRMLAGRPPFLAPSRLETYFQVRDREPVSPRRLNPDVPKAMETICLACLCKDPRRRYASALELADDLRRFLDGRRIRQRPTPAPVRAARWCRRNRAVAALSLALGLAVVVLLVVQGIRFQDAQNARARAEADRLRTEAERNRAEEERARAEESLRFSSDAFGRMVWITDQMFQGVSLAERETIELLSRQAAALYHPLLEEFERGRIDDAGLLSLGVVATIIAARPEVLGGEEALPEVLAVARSSLRACTRKYPGLDTCRWMLVQALADSAWLVAGEDPITVEEAIAYIGEADTITASIPKELYARGTILRVALAKIHIARALISRGEWDAARSFARRVEDDFRKCQTDLRWHPYYGVEFATLLSDLGEEGAAVKLIHSLLRDEYAGPPAGPPTSAVVGWVLRRTGRAQLLWGDIGATADDQIVPAIFGEFERVGIRLEPNSPDWVHRAVLAEGVIARLAKELVALRRDRRIDNAERVADGLFRIAEHLAALAPDDPALLLFLSEAMIQHAKNAWMTDDRARVRSWTARSLDVLRRAAAIDPGDPRLSSLIRDRERRLAELDSP